MKNLVIVLIIVVILILGWVLLFGTGESNEFVSDTGGKEKTITSVDADNDSDITDGRENTGNFDKAPKFALKDYNGNEVTLDQFPGKAKIINSWAVWCPFCRQELADFAAIQKEFGDEVVVIAIDRKESLEKAKGFTDSLGITGEMVFLLDPKDSFYASIGGFSMPETLFIDRNNNIITHKRGFMTLEEMRQKTQALLNN